MERTFGRSVDNVQTRFRIANASRQPSGERQRGKCGENIQHVASRRYSASALRREAEMQHTRCSHRKHSISYDIDVM
jgi:hypothetical protein